MCIRDSSRIGEPLSNLSQTFGDRLNFQPHLHLLENEGGMDPAGVFH